MSGPDLGRYPPEVRPLLAERAARYAALAQRSATAEQIGARLAALSVTAGSRRGEVRVTVSGNGLLTSVDFSQSGLDLGPRALARITLTTLRDALVKLKAAVAVVAGETGGGPVGDGTVAEYTRALSGPLGTLPAAGTDGIVWT